MHAYLVLPAGHGKSYAHGRVSGVYEADSVVNCKATPDLILLRRHARETGEWDAYDTEWIRLLNLALPDEPCVVLVPSSNIGRLAGWTCLGGAVLSYRTWTQNLQNRGDIVGWYRTSWYQTYHEFRVIFETNQELQAWIQQQSERFFASLPR